MFTAITIAKGKMLLRSVLWKVLETDNYLCKLCTVQSVTSPNSDSSLTCPFSNSALTSFSLTPSIRCLLPADVASGINMDISAPASRKLPAIWVWVRPSQVSSNDNTGNLTIVQTSLICAINQVISTFSMPYYACGDYWDNSGTTSLLT